jgi:hypothetical protein
VGVCVHFGFCKTRYAGSQWQCAAALSGCPTVPPPHPCTTGRLLPSSATLSKKGCQPWP